MPQNLLRTKMFLTPTRRKPPGKKQRARRGSITAICDRFSRQWGGNNVGNRGTDYCYYALEPGQPDLFRTHGDHLVQPRIVATYKKAVKFVCRNAV